MFAVRSLLVVSLPVVLFCLGSANPAFGQSGRHLRVSDNGRFLEHADGTPFFWLGDTAWELFHRLDREEAVRYLKNRADKGFTLIQAVVLAELDGLNAPNAYGAIPLLDNNPERPNEAYFEHVDFVVRTADSLGLVIGMLPTWGRWWHTGGGTEPPLFTPESARVYGKFVGARYRNAPIVWILGGDQNPQTPEEVALVEAMARGLREGDGGAHLMTFHPRGPGRSSDFFHAAAWLDFNMFQSSHGGHDHDTGLFAAHDYRLMPPKPTIDGEPRYESIPTGFYFQGMNPADRFDDFDVRQAAYWSLLAGAAGHTYGNNNIWQMWAPGRQSVIGANIPWWEAMDHPGAFHMGLVRRLFESRAFHKLVPDQAMILDGPASGGGKIRAARASDASFAFIYSPMGEPFSIDMAKISGLRVRQTWYDPRYGVEYPAHTGVGGAIQTFTPPTRGRGLDWVLILEGED